MQTLLIDQLVGQTLGSCRVEELLDRGRLSAVYLAQQPAQRRSVAVTAFILPDHFSIQARGRFIVRFSKEAALLSALEHPHILRIYEYGEQFGYPYLITPYVTEGSLARVLKQQGRFSPEYTLELLEQIAAALDYIHSKGVVHGMLKTSNILLFNETKTKQTIKVAGFGLIGMLSMRGIEENNHPQAHLLSIAGTFLGAPEYIAPEFVLGQLVDPRSDIYSLGIMLLEFLGGKLPFSGSNPIEIAMQHVQRPLPPLRSICPDLPVALEAVISRALARDPEKRYRRAGELTAAFREALVGSDNVISFSTGPIRVTDKHNIAMNSVEEGKWQFTPPVVTGPIPVPGKAMLEANAPGREPQAGDGSDSWQLMPPIITGKLLSMKNQTNGVPMMQKQPEEPLTGSVPPPSNNNQTHPTHPFQWWASISPKQMVLPDPGTIQPNTAPPGATQNQFSASQQPPVSRFTPQKKRGMSRRNVVAMLVAGGVVTVGALSFGGIGLAHMLNNTAAPNNTNNASPNQNTDGAVPTATQNTTSNPATSPTQMSGNPTPAPTSQPTTAPTKPTYTGSVVGSTKQQVNSAVSFNNPTDGQSSLLVHLPSGKFKAYEKACTHEGVAVYYDQQSHLLVCPAHGAIFDPANQGKVVQGPADEPLPMVAIRVNADGSITTG